MRRWWLHLYELSIQFIKNMVALQSHNYINYAKQNILKSKNSDKSAYKYNAFNYVIGEKLKQNCKIIKICTHFSSVGFHSFLFFFLLQMKNSIYFLRWYHRNCVRETWKRIVLYKKIITLHMCVTFICTINVIVLVCIYINAHTAPYMGNFA